REPANFCAFQRPASRERSSAAKRSRTVQLAFVVRLVVSSWMTMTWPSLVRCTSSSHARQIFHPSAKAGRVFSEGASGCTNPCPMPRWATTWMIGLLIDVDRYLSRGSWTIEFDEVNTLPRAEEQLSGA